MVYLQSISHLKILYTHKHHRINFSEITTVIKSSSINKYNENSKSITFFNKNE